MNSRMRDENMEMLFQAVLSLQDTRECADFFDDLCTVAELKAMSQRLHVARMLREKHIYTDIVRETGASTATISRVNRCLQYGSDGYNRVLERLEHA